MSTRRISAVSMVAALCLVGACSSDDEPASSDSAGPSSSVSDTQESAGTIAPTSAAVESTQPSVPPSASSAAPTTTASEGGATAGPVDALQAIDFAVTNTPGDAISIEARIEHDVAVWEVVVLQADGTAVEYLVSVATGEILEMKPTRTLVSAVPTVSLVQAIEIATSAVPGSAIVEADLDTASGAVVWDVLVRQPGAGGGTELSIDADTGEILRQEVDD